MKIYRNVGNDGKQVLTQDYERRCESLKIKDGSSGNSLLNHNQAWPRIIDPRGRSEGGHDSYWPIFPRGGGQFFMIQSEKTVFLALS